MATAQDVDRVLEALRAERQLHRQARRDAAAVLESLTDRVAALEARPAPQPVDMGRLLAGIAEIRSDMEARLQALEHQTGGGGMG